MTFGHNIRLPEVMKKAGPEHFASLGDITAEAFKDDPFNVWLFEEFEMMPLTFSELARSVYLPRGFCHLIPSAGATMWLPPNVSNSMPVLPSLKLALPALFRYGPAAIKRLVLSDQALARHHPKEPHVYLFSIGVLASARGEGLGRQLMSPVLQACDKAGLPVYLESSNPDNHGFYAGLGFQTKEIFSPIAGSPPMEAMWRDPAVE